jgi:hypothetical protein
MENRWIEDGLTNADGTADVEAFFTQFNPEDGDFLAALQYVLNFPVDENNFNWLHGRVIELAGGYSPSFSLKERVARVLMLINYWPEEKRQELLTPPQRHR